MRAVISILLFALAVAGCVNRRAEPARNLLVVVVDALRADHVGCYGYARPTTPAIDALAADGTRFDQAFTTAPWTLPAMASLWTSLYPSVHGAAKHSDMWQWTMSPKTFAPTSVLADQHLTLAELLRQSDFRTAAFVNGGYPGRIFGTGQGFEHFEDDRLPGIRLNVEALLSWLDRDRSKRFFAYLHPKGAHAPYEPRRPEQFGSPNHFEPERRRWFAVLTEERQRRLSFDFDPGYEGPVDGTLETLARLRTMQLPDEHLRHLVALYDQGVRYTDHWIGELVQGLRSRDLYDDTVIVVLADHGEELFDHGGLEHSKTFYDEVMRIPLVARIPGTAPGRVVNEQVSMVDIAPTLLEALGLPPLPRAQGRSLLPLFGGGDLPDLPVYGEASVLEGRSAQRRPGWKYIDTPGAGEELYDLAADPRESSNLCGPAPARCRPFRDELARWHERQRRYAADLALPPAPTAAVDEKVRNRLRELGYAE